VADVSQILSALGAGSVGEVYRARDTKRDRDVGATSMSGQLLESNPVRDHG
jgi:hypothetical protein